MQSGTATTRYVIRTTAGDRGPFSAAEIGRLVDDGRIAPTTRILDLEARRAVTAREAIAMAASEATAVLPPAAVAAATDPATARTETLPAAATGPTARMPGRPASMSHTAPPAGPVAPPSRGRRRTTEDNLDATDALPPPALGGDTALEPRPATDGDPATTATRPLPLPRRRRSETAAPTAGPGSATGLRRSATVARRRPARARGWRRWLPIVLSSTLALAVVLGVAGVMLHHDRYPGQAEALYARVLASPSLVATPPEGDPWVRELIRRAHPAALAAARLPRGYFQGYQPAVDEEKYLTLLRAAVRAHIEAATLQDLDQDALELAVARSATPDDLLSAKALALRGLKLSQEKDWKSLHVLAVVDGRTGDPVHAALIDEQAEALAPDADSRAECAATLAVWRAHH